MHNFLATARLACGEKYRTTHYWPMVREALRIAEEEAYRTGVRESSSLAAPMSVEYAQELIVDWMSKVAERDQGAFTMLLRQGGLA